jgi:hypothetical protein
MIKLLPGAQVALSLLRPSAKKKRRSLPIAHVHRYSETYY